MIVAHGISYDGTGVYDNYLGPSELNSALTAEATTASLTVYRSLPSGGMGPIREWPLSGVMSEGVVRR